MNKLGLWQRRIYNSLKDFKRRFVMPDYPQQEWGTYSLRLRPNDPIRFAMSRLGLPDMLNYFNSSTINLDLRICVPNIKNNRSITDTFTYEWIFCTEDDTPVIRTSDPRFHLYNVEGSGVFEVDTKQPQKNKPFKTSYYRYQDRYLIMVFKDLAVRIGNYSKLGHYKIIMRFIDKMGTSSEYVCMAEFTIIDKDKLRHWFLLSIGTLLFAGIAGIIFKACGISPIG